MPRIFPLAAVLAVRQQKEDAEERSLLALGAQLQGIQTAIQHVQTELDLHGDTRAREIDQTHFAVHHQSGQARWANLRAALLQLQTRLRALEIQKAEQQARYLAARSDREMLTELRTTQRTAWEAELAGREAKRIMDLFAARRPRR